MSLALLFVLMVFAAWRATRLVTTDTIVDSWRHRLFLRFPPDEHYRSLEPRQRPGSDEVVWFQHPTTVRPTHPLGQLIDCGWCVGWWIAGAVWGLVWHYHGLPLPGLWWPAVAGAAGFGARLER